MTFCTNKKAGLICDHKRIYIGFLGSVHIRMPISMSRLLMSTDARRRNIWANGLILTQAIFRI